jgi:lambda repressor-like predicted transcriptional regulator
MVIKKVVAAQKNTCHMRKYSLTIPNMKPNEIRAALLLAEPPTSITAIARKLGLKPQGLHMVITGLRPNPRIRAAIAEAIGKPVSEIWPDSKTNQEEAA